MLMRMAHQHAHTECAAEGSSGRRLAATLALAASYMVAEAVGGWWTGSLALLADASHMLSDVLALVLALTAIGVARRSVLPHPHGAHRFELLAAFAQGVLLVGIAGTIAVEAWQRLGTPPAVLGGPMLAIATGGLLVNVVGLALLHGGRHESLNLRGAWLHVASDALGSVGAMAAGLAVWKLGWLWADPLASALIAVLVARSAGLLVRDTARAWAAIPAAGEGDLAPRADPGS
jgi:cobalt-zinc-cadmium efflux system protein